MLGSHVQRGAVITGVLVRRGTESVVGPSQEEVPQGLDQSSTWSWSKFHPPTIALHLMNCNMMESRFWWSCFKAHATRGRTFRGGHFYIKRFFLIISWRATYSFKENFEIINFEFM